MPVPPRLDDLDIPDRPAVSSEPERRLVRRRVLLWGGIAAAALIALLVIVLQPGEERQRLDRLPADAPLIKADDEPIKVPPESPGGLDVPNRDIRIYSRLEHDKPNVKPPVERLLPEPEQPLPPPHPVDDLRRLETAPEKSEPDEQAADVASPEDFGDETSPPPAVLPPPVAAPRATKPEKTEISPKPSASVDGAAKPVPSASGSYQVQLFAGRSQDDAEAAWSTLKARNGDLLAGLSPVFVRADLGDRGTFYRLRAGPVGSDAQARRLCTALSARRVSCIVVRAGG